jgi:hypothetical protein
VFLKRSCLIALCLCVVVAQGCRRTNETDLTLKLEISPQPPRVGQSHITLRATDGTGKPLTGAQISLEGHMSHAGMSPVFARVTEVEPGRYAGVIDLSMAGDWILIVHLALPGKETLQRQFEVKGVMPA